MGLLYGIILYCAIWCYVIFFCIGVIVRVIICYCDILYYVICVIKL